MHQPLMFHRQEDGAPQTVEKGEKAASVLEIRPQALQGTLGKEILRSLREEVALISVRNVRGARQLIVGQPAPAATRLPHRDPSTSHETFPMPSLPKADADMPLPR
jgi:hypothetical protein